MGILKLKILIKGSNGMSCVDIIGRCVVTRKLVINSPMTQTGNRINVEDWEQEGSRYYKTN